MRKSWLSNRLVKNTEQGLGYLVVPGQFLAYNRELVKIPSSLASGAQVHAEVLVK